MFSECSLKDFYDFTQWRGLGNSMWYDNLEEILKNVLKLLKQKYPDTDFRVKFLKALIIKSETHEIEVEQEEALRALLHYESYPDEHTLEDIVLFCENSLNNSDSLNHQSTNGENKQC